MRISVSTIVIWVFIAILIAINIASFVSGQSYIAVVSGSSMEPILSTGDVVFILPVRSPSDISLGDVIVYKSQSGRYIIHRVINIISIGGKTYFVTKGDNNPIPDAFGYGYPGVPFENIVGKVISVGGSVLKIPYIGIISLLRGS
ncbi:MAG: signal peptidase I [Sulfolobales archaeon]